MLLALATLLASTTAEARHHRSHRDKSKPQPTSPVETKPDKTEPPAESKPKRGKVDATLLTMASGELEPPPAGESGAVDYAALLRTLEDGYRKAPSPEPLFAIGRLTYILGRTVEAQDLMRRYLADPLTDAAAPNRLEAQRIAELPRVPSGEVQVVAEQEGLISIDGRLAGVLPLPLPLLVSVGQHVVSLEMRDKTMKGKIKVLDGRGAVMRFSTASGAVLVTLPPAAIVLPRYVGRFQPDAQRRLQQLVEQRLQKARLAAYSKEAALSKAPELVSCQATQPCQVQLCKKSEVEYALPIVVERRGNDVALKLQLIDSETETVAASAERDCAACSPAAVNVVVDELLERVLKEGAGRPRGTLSVTSQPGGADVYEGEQLLGKTPYEHIALTGNHELVVRQPGYAPGQVTVQVLEGKKATGEVTLALANPAKPPSRPRWRVLAGVALVGTGLLFGGIGISGIALDNTCAVAADSPGGQCRERFDTKPAGGALLGIGLGMTAAGTILLAVPLFPGEKRPANP